MVGNPDAGIAASLAVDLARRLPPGDITRLAAAAAAGPGTVADLRARATSPVLRDACERVSACAGVTADWLAGAMIGAANAFAHADATQTLDVVWTGPESEIETGRLTAPAVAELIEAARHELLVVSYASRDEARLTASLQGAADRGVDITLIFERHDDNPAYRGDEQPFDDLPARRWVWPRALRPAGAALHAKIIVVDATIALLGSANLTGRAMATNLECGVLIRGGPQPKAIRDHLWSLRYRNILQQV